MSFLDFETDPNLKPLLVVGGGEDEHIFENPNSDGQKKQNPFKVLALR